MREITHSLLESLHIPSGLMIEIGCGGGAFAQELAMRRQDRSIVGIDINEQAITVSNQRRTERLLFAQADLEQPPLEASTAACVIALDSFDQQGINLRSALTESCRILRQDGLLVMESVLTTGFGHRMIKLLTPGVAMGRSNLFR